MQEARQKVLMHWSGGKDSAMALYLVKNQQYLNIQCLLTTVNDSYQRIAMHGVRETLLVQQAESIGIPLRKVMLPEMPDMQTYEQIIGEEYRYLAETGICNAIFGDIFLEDLRHYREKQLAKYNMHAIFPLWKENSLKLLSTFLALGFKTIVVCAQDGLEEFCGRVIDNTFINDLPKGIDPCGENGEFHTFVFDGPIFQKPIQFEIGERVYKEFPSPERSAISGFWYQDLVPINVNTSLKS